MEATINRHCGAKKGGSQGQGELSMKPPLKKANSSCFVRLNVCV
jgi:hypothetical protein